MRIGLTGAQDLLALLNRRKWWIAIPFIGLVSALAVLIIVLPPMYVSETLILIRPREVPENFVMDLIAGTTEQRIKSIQQTVLSRTNLIEILREFETKLPEFRRLNMDQRVGKLRELIKIDLQLEKPSAYAMKPPALTSFKISYQNQDPELAQSVTRKLTELFIDQDNKVREDQVFGTTDFLSNELEKVSEQLKASETKLRQIKSTRQFELPTQLDANLRTLDRLGGERQSNAEALDRSATQRMNLEALILQTPAEVPITQRSATSSSPLAAAAAVDPLIAEYKKTELEYKQATAKYKDIHPEVQSGKARLERLKQQMSPESLALAMNEIPDPTDPTKTIPEPKKTTEPNPLYLRLVGQLEELKTEIIIRERERKILESDIAKYHQRVENTPHSEQEIQDVDRQNSDLQKQYDELKSKLDQARLSGSLESKQKGSTFVIVDPANLPIVPAGPNRKALIVYAMALSLAVGIALAVVVDVTRQRIWTQSEIEAFWGVPVLVDIPEILTDVDHAVVHKRKVTYVTSIAAGAVAYSVCLYAVYMRHVYILHLLDPILQRVAYK